MTTIEKLDWTWTAIVALVCAIIMFVMLVCQLPGIIYRVMRKRMKIKTKGG